MSWTEKKPNISGNLIIDGTIEGDQIKSDTDLTVGNLTADYLKIDDGSSGTATGQGTTLFIDSTSSNFLCFGSPLNQNAGINFGDPNDDNVGQISYNHADNSMRFTVNASEAVRINDDGYVGVGVTDPEAPLHTNKYVASGMTPYWSSGVFIDDASSAALQFGSVWYGTQQIMFGKAANGSTPQDDDIGSITYSQYSQSLNFAVNVGTKMTINSAGYVGIGTTAPTRKLTVKNGSSNTGSSSSATLFLDSTSSNYIQMGGSSSGLQGIIFGDSNDNDVGYIQYYHGSNYMRFAVNAGERMRIDSSGRVGIGTTSPTEKLDINADTIRLRTAKTPTSSTAQGYQGEICYDSNYMYICVAYNTWKRIPLETW